MNRHKVFVTIGLIIIFSICFITVGYASLSTSLSIDGSASFKPVDMIRVMSITPFEMNTVDEIKSSYDTNSINALIDITDISGNAIFNVNITNLGQKDKILSKILPDIFSNDDMEYEIIGLKEGDVIKKGKSINFKINFKYKKEITKISSTRLNAKIKFLFDDYIDISTDNEIKFDDDGDIVLLKYNGDCKFNGKDNNITGVCANLEERDFINTGIKLFNEKNYKRNFILSFKMKDVDNSRFSSNKRDTIFSALYEASDTIKGKYPGIALRIEGSKWQIQAGNGRAAAVKKQFTKDELLNKKFTIIRYTKDNVTNVYYMIDDEGPFLLNNISNLYSTFDTPLSLGANLQIDNITPDRFALATLENFSFEFFSDNFSIDDIINKIITPEPESEPEPEPEEPNINDNTTIFAVNGPCTFNANANITGDNCLEYLNKNYINSNINIFSSENYQKDLEISLNIDNFNPSDQTTSQATILNSLIENKDKSYPAFVIRRNSDKINLILRNGVDTDKNILLPASTKSIKIVRKNGKVCYSINGENLIYALDYSKVTKTFDLPVTFGASLDQNKNPWRYIKATLSNMSIKLGNIGDDVVCQEN